MAIYGLGCACLLSLTIYCCCICCLPHNFILHAVSPEIERGERIDWNTSVLLPDVSAWIK